MSYRMTIPLSNVVTARVVLLAALLLGGLVAAVSLYHSVYAQETMEYPENGEGPVAAYTAVDPEGDGVIWTLSGTDADDFSIEGGVLKFESSPNYESPTSSVATGTLDQKNTYTVTVEATDTEATKNMLPVIVKVTNVDEPGEATLSTQQPLEELALTAALSDPDGANSESWQWSRSSSANGPWTDIRDATTAAHTPTADDVDRYLLATASYNDGEGKYKSAAVVSANPVQMKLYVNQAPVFQDAEGNEISGAQTIGRSVAEDAAAGGAVGGPVAATDTVGEVLTYSLSGTDAASFDIDSATGQITVDAGTLDFETKKTHDVTVTATDPLGLTDTIGVTITVTDVDEAPMVTGGATVKYHPENTPVATSVSTYTATDDDDDNDEPKKPRKWSLSGADSDKFEISAVSGSNSTTDAELTFKASPDFEAKASAGGNNIYVLTVVATDSGGQTASRDVTVRVTNVEEEGTVTVSSVQPEVGVALTASLTDPDGEISGLTWQWARADTTGVSYTAIVGATSAVYTPVSADDTRYLRAAASYTDGEGSGKSQREESANLVQPHDTTNVAPVFSPETVSISVPESTTGNLGAAVMATDDDNLTYSLGGSDASSFTIERSSGQINVAAGTLDYETKQTHNVTVTATDASLESDTATVTITVTNVNEKPTLAGPASISHDENTANTEAVADYTAADPEGTQIFWALTGNDNGDFSISTSGVLTFVASPDYEDPADTGTDNVYNVTVEASDTNSNTSTLSVTVTVTNLDEDGTVTFTSLQPKVDVELTAMLTDPDGGTTNTAWQWSKSSSASGSWTDIMGATAEAYTPVAGDMDSYLRATASYDDGEGKYKTAAAVSDNAVEPEVPVNRAPAFEDADGDEIATITREVAENTAADGNVGAPVAARDPDNDTLTYTLGSVLDSGGSPVSDTANDPDSFTIDSGTGQVGVGDGTELNFETKQSYTVTVTATDPSGDDVTITVTIGVTDVDEDPSLTGPSEVFHAEHPATTTVATYAATDDEDDNDVPSKSLKWSLSGADADDFSIAAGALKFKSKPDYEAPTDTGSNNMYDITVEATDSDGNTASKDVTVTVTNVEEDGEVILLSLQPQDGIPLRAELTDPDGGVSGVTWKWEWYDPGSGGCSNVSNWMPITRDNAKSAIYTPVKADEGDCLKATADYTDAHGSGKSADLVTVNEVQAADTSNQPPVFPDKDPSTDGVQNEQMEISVPEDTAPVAAIGAPVGANDSDDTNLTYTLGGLDAGSFTIVPGTGQISVGGGTMLDYEMKQSYTVTVTATDPSLESAVITVTIKITDVDEAPEISKKSLVIGGRRSIDYLENGESQVATYTAAGRQAAGATWRLAGEDGADFSITTGGVLSFDAPPDYENPADRNEDNEYRITLHASDPGGNTAELGVTVRVANVDEEGTVTLSPAQPYVGAEITAAITDPDGGVAGAMWQWARSPDGLSDWTDITDATLETYTPAEDDVDSYLRAMVSYGDAESVGKGAEAVSDAPVGTNRAPEFPASETGQRTVPDSTAPAGNVGDPVVATDPDEDTLTYTLGPVLDSGGDPVSDTANDPDSFAIDSGTGQITVGTGTTLNARTKDTYTVLVTATDPSDESDTITVTITVTLDLFNRYDLNNNGRIDKPEVLDAIDDYFAFLIPKDDVLDVIDLYFSG